MCRSKDEPAIKTRKSVKAKNSEMYKYVDKRTGKMQYEARVARKKKKEEEEEAKRKSDAAKQEMDDEMKKAKERVILLEDENRRMREEAETKEEKRRRSSWWMWTFDAEEGRETEEAEREYWTKLGRRMSPWGDEEELEKAKRMRWFLEGVEAKRRDSIPPWARDERGERLPAFAVGWESVG